MKKILLGLAIVFVSALFFACGDDVTTEQVTAVSQDVKTGLDVIDSIANLPKCGKDNNGHMVWVSDVAQMQVCVNGSWKPVRKPAESSKDSISTSQRDTIKTTGSVVEFECYSKSLADDSGEKIICNGDSIGVVLNGQSGSVSLDPLDCVLKESSDTVLAMQCGDAVYSINLKEDGVSCEDSADEDADCLLDEDALSGYVQKGPFLKGTVVIAHELQNGKNLKQTGNSFTGYINSTNGLFNIKSVKLASQYALLMAEGFFRNEVTGKNSANPIKLRALTNLKGRHSANVNLMTHLEYERIVYLVTQKGKKVSDAKRQAEYELFKAFNLDTTGLKLTGNSEDLAIFGNSERNAALLAISILLLGDRNESELLALLTNFSEDFAKDGTWTDSLARDSIVFWAKQSEKVNALSRFRENVKSWNLGEVPPFEKYIHRFWINEYGLPYCDGKKVKMGDTLVSNTGEKYRCVDESTGRLETVLLKDERDGRQYRAVTIDGKTWMAENLNFRYPLEMPDDAPLSFCNDDDCAEYGRYYKWAAALDTAGLYSQSMVGCGIYGVSCDVMSSVRGVCPRGWHIPSSNEVESLYGFVGEKPLSLLAKNEINDLAASDATDDYGFSAVLAGYRNGSEAFVSKQNLFDVWLSDYDPTSGTCWKVYRMDAVVHTCSRDFAITVRCVEDHE